MSKYPDWLENKTEREKWDKPWTVELTSTKDKDFKQKLWNHGYISPHFTRKEAQSRRFNGTVADIPDSLRANAQYHGFALERARHALGDKSMNPLDWYRDPVHNSEVGGATQSAHMQANATDWAESERERLGGNRFDDVMDAQFAHGGRGYQGVVGGPIRHVDNGPERVWTY